MVLPIASWVRMYETELILVAVFIFCTIVLVLWFCFLVRRYDNSRIRFDWTNASTFTRHTEVETTV